MNVSQGSKEGGATLLFPAPSLETTPIFELDYTLVKFHHCVLHGRGTNKTCRQTNVRITLSR